jgi:hypothetical protein
MLRLSVGIIALDLLLSLEIRQQRHWNDVAEIWTEEQPWKLKRTPERNLWRE